MCLGGGGGDDDYAEEQRRQEEERQRRVREGIARINQIFGGPITEFVQKTPEELVGYSSPVAPSAPNYMTTIGGKTFRVGQRAMDSADARYAREIEQYKSANARYNMLLSRALANGPQYKEVNRGNAPGQFTDDFYEGIGKSYLDFYTPELERQFEDARKQNIFKYANQGQLESGTANTKFGDLQRAYQEQRAGLADKALAEQQRVRGEVEQNRADLISQLESGAGVESTAQSALARARAMSAPQQYSPLGDAFAQFTQGLNLSRQLQGMGYRGIEGTERAPNLLGARGSSTSVRTV